MNLSLPLKDQHSSSTESTGLPHLELNAMGKTSSQDQCASSDSVQDEGNHGQSVKQPALFLCNPEMPIDASQAEISHHVFPYGYPDPYLSGLFTAYGPHTMIQPQMMGSASGRVPLPADLPDDGPIYVNAKQYHGILRRRQTRAKLEAQNKLVKNRRPYLHESRHQHALNRVRGTGGRFLSTKKSQHSDSHLPTSSQNTADSFHFNQQGNMSTSNEYRFESMQHDGPQVPVASGADTSYQQTDGRFPAVSMQGSGLVYNGNRHYASIVR